MKGIRYSDEVKSEAIKQMTVRGHRQWQRQRGNALLANGNKSCNTGLMSTLPPSAVMADLCSSYIADEHL